MLDLNNKSVISTRQGATPLAARCQREYHWDEPKCRKVLKAYRQFLFLKKNFQDWDATILSPSGPVDQMWHQHLLDVTHYCHDTMLLCGHVVGYDPDGALDDAMKARRTKTTRDALVEHFGSDYAKEMWLTHAEMRTQEENTTVDDTDEDPITLELRDQTGGRMGNTRFKIKRSSKIKKLFDVYAQMKNVPKHELRFYLDGEEIDGETDDTVAVFELDDFDYVDVKGTAVNNDDPITIQLRDQTGEVTYFKIKRSSELNKVLYKYAERKGVHIDSLVSFLDGEKIDGKLTVAELELDDMDQFDVMLEQSGC